MPRRGQPDRMADLEVGAYVLDARRSSDQSLWRLRSEVEHLAEEGRLERLSAGAIRSRLTQGESGPAHHEGYETADRQSLLGLRRRANYTAHREGCLWHTHDGQFIPHRKLPRSVGGGWLPYGEDRAHGEAAPSHRVIGDCDGAGKEGRS